MSPTADDDYPPHAELLRIALDEHPAPLTLREAALAMRLDPDTFAGMDTVRVALSVLAADGLLHHRGDDIRPTRAAVRAIALLTDQ